MSNQLIHAETVTLVRGQRLLFKQLSFDLSKGQALHLSGANGSGKTGLFKMLTGSLTPSNGQLLVLGKNPKKFAACDLQKIIYLGHKTTVKPQLTVIENLRLSSAIFDNIKANQKQLNYALAAVGLQDYIKQQLAHLSAGQKRKVMLARLWVSLTKHKTQKSLWLLDEPLTALDTGTVLDLQHLIDKHLKLGGGALFASHQKMKLSQSVKSITFAKTN